MVLGGGGSNTEGQRGTRLTLALWPAMSWSSSVCLLVLLCISKSSVSKSESSSSSGVCGRRERDKKIKRVSRVGKRKREGGGLGGGQREKGGGVNREH